MKVTPTALPEVLLIEPLRHTDARGFFTERFNQRDFARATGQNVQFVQDNHSHSQHAVLRGLHYQSAEPQGKLVQVQSGRVFDVAVDVRANSPTLGQWVGLQLSSAHPQQLWIPAGFAHGFLVLSEQADVLYKTTTYYQPETEQVLAWNDPSLAIAWPLAALRSAPLLSARDAVGQAWPDAPRLALSSAG